MQKCVTVVKLPNEIDHGHIIPGEILIDNLEEIAQEYNLTIERAKEFAGIFLSFACGKVEFEKREVTDDE